MSSGNRSSNVLFVGNLPYDYTEEQMLDMFRTVGPVKSVRLVFERDSHKPRGFGFCEFYDIETAASALRNLNGMDVGGRSLRLDFADPEDEPRRDRSERRQGGRGQEDKPLQVPKGVTLAPGQNAADVISQTLATMPPNQLLDVMVQMKALITTSPDQAKTLLNSNPQVTYALFQALIMMNIVDASVLQRLLTNGNPAAAPAPVPVAAPTFAPPPVYQQPVPAPPQPTAPATAPDQSNAHALIAQVLAMTDDQINMLPADQKATILHIRAQARGLAH